MPTAIKLWTGYFLLEFLPALELPMKDLELLNVMAQIRHVFGGETFIWGMGTEGERYVRYVGGIPKMKLTV